MQELLDTGRAPSAAETAAALGLPEADAERAYRDLGAAHAFELHPGTLDVWMAHPLSAVPTPYVATVNGRDHFASCIWDGLGVVAMLGGSGFVRTTCEDCGESLQVDVVQFEIAGEPEGVVHFAVPAWRWYDDIGDT
jgi:alkylmercury lyase-like protein